jgi:hypothetical protein
VTVVFNLLSSVALIASLLLWKKLRSIEAKLTARLDEHEKILEVTGDALDNQSLALQAATGRRTSTRSMFDPPLKKGV